jgi:D-galactarolactone cycloisomerase
MEFDRTPSAIREELCTTTFEQEGGYVAVPTGPGLGIEVDLAALERMRVQPTDLQGSAGKRSVVFT